MAPCSVCPSVTFVYSVKKNEHIFKNFSPSASHTMLVFPYQTSWQYSDGNLPNGVVKCRWCIKKLLYLTNISLHSMLSMLWPPAAINTTQPDHGKLWHSSLGSSSICSSRETTTKCLWQKASTLRRRQQNLIVRTGKSEAEVTNNRRVWPRHCTTESNYWQTRSIMWPLCLGFVKENVLQY